MFGKQIKNKIISILAVLMVGLVATGVTTPVIEETTAAVPMVGMIIGAVVVVLVASALMNTTANNAAAASAGLTAHGSTGAAGIVDQWTLGIAIAVFIGIFSFIL
jgi:hypothetical protein